MKQLEGRRYTIGLIFLVVGIIFLIRLFYVQVIDTHYKLDARNNVLRKVIKYPARGLIYDRNGELLVYNEAAYDLMIVPRQVKREFDTLAFCRLLEIEIEQFREKFNKAKKYSRYKPSIFEKEISARSYAKIQEQLFKYPGFFVQTRTLRTYPQQTAAHLLGYVGEASPKIIEKDPYYKSGDHIGISGIEKEYEVALRGKSGVEVQMVDVHNRDKGKFMDGALDTTAISGSDLQLTIDAKLQAYGEKLMQNKKGSIVAIDPSTGEILALVSMPTYDPNLLVGRARSNNYATLSQDTLKPLFNRALMAKYPPGSTFKSINALIGLQENVLTPNTYYSCSQGYRFGGRKMGCHAHPSPVNLEYSIQTSCNAYYCNVFRSIVDKYQTTEEGYNVWRNYVTNFGLGKKTGIDLPNELSGFVPGTDYYDRYYQKGRWHSTTILSLAIGQGELGFTPMQMANMTAAIANRGHYITPHIVRSVNAEGITQLDSTIRRNETGVAPEHFDKIVEAMYKVVQQGTGTQAKIDSLQVCGKTGTVQNPHGDDHSTFIAFAPKDNPKIALSVYVENGYWGSRWAAPIAGLLIEEYLRDTITRPLIEQRMLEGNLIGTALKIEEDAGSKSLIDNIDWITVGLYFVLILAGWLNIYAAVYNEDFQSIFDTTQRYGKQLLWIGTATVLAVVILLIDERFFSTFGYLIYGVILLLLVAVIFTGAVTKGATSWFAIGGFKIQPSEFSKFATNLALAKYLSTLNIRMTDFKTKVTAAAIIGLPAILILLQNDTGSALVYGAFILVLFREGLSGNFLLIGISVAFLFVMTLIFQNEVYALPFDISLGGSVMLMIALFLLLSAFYYFNRKKKKILILLSVIFISCVGLIKSVDYVFNNILEPHQSKRINVMLGIESDPYGAGYNVNQSLIAIGSGGFSGKGYLQGTQTKYDFVPEQSTDFIFCTIGEEWGFIGSFFVVALFMTLLLRILFLCSRQRSAFARIYGYGVAAIFFFHFTINIGMTIGLAPVIGIPLPFFSYGGSSLWAFTILLFVFIKMDADRLEVL